MGGFVEGRIGGWEGGAVEGAPGEEGGEVFVVGEYVGAGEGEADVGGVGGGHFCWGLGVVGLAEVVDLGFSKFV